jgi:hypothetical protein
LLSGVKSTPTLAELLRNPDVQAIIGVHQHEGTTWFDKGGFEYLLWWVFAVRVQEVLTVIDKPADAKLDEQKILELYKRIDDAKKAAVKSEFHFPELLELLDPDSALAKKKVPAKAAAAKPAPAKKVAPKKPEEPGLF